MEFKDRFLAALQSAGITQKEAAERIGCNPHMITSYLRGAEPRLSMYERILDAFPELREPEMREPVAP